MFAKTAASKEVLPSMCIELDRNAGSFGSTDTTSMDTNPRLGFPNATETTSINKIKRVVRSKGSLQSTETVAQSSAHKLSKIEARSLGFDASPLLQMTYDAFVAAGHSANSMHFVIIIAILNRDLPKGTRGQPGCNALRLRIPEPRWIWARDNPAQAGIVS